MRRRWEAEHRGAGRFLLRPRRRSAYLVPAGIAGLVAAGAVARLWERIDAWLRANAHTTVPAVAAIASACAAVVWLWVRSGRR